MIVVTTTTLSPNRIGQHHYQSEDKMNDRKKTLYPLYSIYKQETNKIEMDQ